MGRNGQITAGRIQATGDRRHRRRRNRPQEAHRRWAHSRLLFRARARAGAFAREHVAPFSSPRDGICHRCWAVRCARRRHRRRDRRVDHNQSSSSLLLLCVLLAVRHCAVPKPRTGHHRGPGAQEPARRLLRQTHCHYCTLEICSADDPSEGAAGRPGRGHRRRHRHAARRWDRCRATRRCARRDRHRRPI